MLRDHIVDETRHAPHPRVHLESGGCRDWNRAFEPRGAYGKSPALEQRLPAVVDLRDDAVDAGRAHLCEVAAPLVGGSCDRRAQPDKILEAPWCASGGLRK